MENQENLVPNEEASMETDYVEAIKNLKENSVSKADYDALRLENKKLLQAVVNGQTIEVEPVEPEVDLAQLRKNVFDNPNQTNLEYVTKVLKLRDAVLEKEGYDVFVPQSSQYSPTQDDIARAQRVAKQFKEMVDIADGNPNVFLNEFQRRVKDDMPIRRKK